MNNTKLTPIIFFFILIVSISTCKKEDPPTQVNNNGEWLIPVEHVLSGGPGIDGIPSVDNPQFAKASEITYLQEYAFVLGIKIGNTVRAYPHPILDWHEIINDEFDDKAIAITYCPLTGTGIAWDANINGQNTTFGVSGLLYNSNLMPYDRKTTSLWSQMRLDCVNGELISDKIETIQMVETVWKTWKEQYPDSDVVTTNTGFNRDYSAYPYGDYKTNNSLNFPVIHEDNRLHKKERVLGVKIGNSITTYRFESFAEEKRNVVYDEVNGEMLVVFGSKDEKFIVAYNSELEDGTVLDELTPVQDGGAIIAEDVHGNKLNLFGEVIDGPQKDKKLKNVTSFMGFWFSWGAFFNPSIYGQ